MVSYGCSELGEMERGRHSAYWVCSPPFVRGWRVEEEGTGRRRSRSLTRKRIGVERGKVERVKERERERERKCSHPAKPLFPFPTPPHSGSSLAANFSPPHPLHKPHPPPPPPPTSNPPPIPLVSSPTPPRNVLSCPFFGRSPEAGERGGYSGSHFHFFKASLSRISPPSSSQIRWRDGERGDI